MRTTSATLIAGTFVATVSAFGQAGGVASISGTVHDPSGSVLANAKVVVSIASKGEVRSVDTNEAGVFTAPALVPEPGYQLTVTAPGFAQYDLKDIDFTGRPESGFEYLPDDRAEHYNGPDFRGGRTDR